MKKAQNILIAGFGDIGQRVARRLRTSRHYRVWGLTRNAKDFSRQVKLAKSLRVQLKRGDLSSPPSLRHLAGSADTVLHFVPPPGTGLSDTHTRNFLAKLSAAYRSEFPIPVRPRMLPRRIVYISTTGVYGNCHGEWVDETRPAKPESARAKRRVDAERRLKKWGRLHDVSITILRVPGIYAEDRLPLDRLRRQTPVLLPADDVFTNHIHADDLAAAVVKAMQQRWPKRYRHFNVVDDSQLRMGDYFDQVADAFDLARPPRIGREEAESQIAPSLLSFMRESRRISNARMKRELGVVLNFPALANLLTTLELQVKRSPN